MNWISVDERLPEEEMEIVLAYWDKSGCKILRYSHYHNGFLDRYSKYIYTGITHWMPVPDAPEGAA